MMRRGRWWMVALLLLAACAPPTPSPQATEAPPTASPPILAEGETPLCRKATRLVLPSALIPAEAVRWALQGASGETLRTGGLEGVAEATISFPQGEPLPPGTYRVALLDAEGHEVALYRFRVTDRPPQLETAQLLLTPDGPQVDSLPAGTRLFYVRYAYRDACQGAPLWLTVEQGEQTICSQMTTLPSLDGEGVLACYRQGGQVLEGGEYRLLLTLADDAVRGLSFRVEGGEPPQCEAPFVAAAITPEGEPFRAGETFEWYTEALYLGRRCYGLEAGLPWESRWYREGKLVRRERGLWHGGEVGLVWDSLTGVEGDPFLKPGHYTATLQVGALAPVEVAFCVIPYVKRD